MPGAGLVTRLESTLIVTFSSTEDATAFTDWYSDQILKDELLMIDGSRYTFYKSSDRVWLFDLNEHTGVLRRTAICSLLSHLEGHLDEATLLLVESD